MINSYTEAITKRFQQVALEIMTRNKLNGGSITTNKAFAESISVTPQNFSKYSTHGQHISMPIFEAVCRIHKVNPIWLHSGKGEMFLADDAHGQLTTLEARVKRLEKLLAR